MNEEDLTDSYSQEANENMKVAIENLVTNLTQVGSADAYKNALFGLKIMVDKRPRRITDVANVEPGLKPRSLDLMVYSRELIPLVVEEIKLAGFKNVTSDIELQRVTIIVPAPTLEDLERIEDDLDRVARSTVSNLTKVKANSSQRLKAGLENEYIEVAEAGKARKNLDEIIDHYVEIAKLHVLKKRIKVMGKYFQPKPEDEKLMKKLKNFKG
jgi:ribosome recycling factor|tara:strand:+ start:396 stop:1034 length:639 start_codon:yes stop_codon:yes gene_type:complete